MYVRHKTLPILEMHFVKDFAGCSSCFLRGTEQRFPTKVKHEAGSAVKINPHVLPFAHCCFHNSALQCCLKLGRLDPINDLYRFKYTSAAGRQCVLPRQAYCHLQLLVLPKYVCLCSDVQPVFCMPPLLVALACHNVKSSV